MSRYITTHVLKCSVGNLDAISVYNRSQNVVLRKRLDDIEEFFAHIRAHIKRKGRIEVKATLRVTWPSSVPSPIHFSRIRNEDFENMEWARNIVYVSSLLWSLSPLRKVRLTDWMEHILPRSAR